MQFHRIIIHEELLFIKSVVQIIHLISRLQAAAAAVCAAVPTLTARMNLVSVGRTPQWWRLSTPSWQDWLIKIGRLSQLANNPSAPRV